MLKFKVFLTICSLIISAYAQDQCYCKSSSKIFVCVLGLPCGKPNAAGFSSCCSKGDTCGNDGFCRYTQADSGISGYYMGPCTDPTYSDSSCPKPCTDNPRQDAVYNATSGSWACCYNKPGGAVDCSETFKADSPMVLFAGPVTSSPLSTASSSTSPTTSTSASVPSSISSSSSSSSSSSLSSPSSSPSFSPSSFSTSASATNQAQQQQPQQQASSSISASPTSSSTDSTTITQSSSASTTKSPTTPLTNTTDPNSATTSLSFPVKIVIAVLGTIFFVAFVTGAIYLLRRRRRRQRQRPTTPQNMQSQNSQDPQVMQASGHSGGLSGRDVRYELPNGTPNENRNVTRNGRIPRSEVSGGSASQELNTGRGNVDASGNVMELEGRPVATARGGE